MAQARPSHTNLSTITILCKVLPEDLAYQFTFAAMGLPASA